MMGSVLLQKEVTLLQTMYVCLEKMAQKEIGFIYKFIYINVYNIYKDLGLFPPWQAGRKKLCRYLSCLFMCIEDLRLNFSATLVSPRFLHHKEFH